MRSSWSEEGYTPNNACTATGAEFSFRATTTRAAAPAMKGLSFFGGKTGGFENVGKKVPQASSFDPRLSLKLRSCG